MRSPPAVVLISLLCACDTSPSAPPQSTTIGDGISVSAKVIVEDRDELGRGATTLHALVTFTNTSTARATVPVSGCPGMLRLYPDAARGGKPLWDQEGLIGGACDGPKQLTLGPGMVQTLESVALPGQLLGDSLPPGDYYFAVQVKLPDRSVLLAADHGRVSFGLDSVTFSGSAAVTDIAPTWLTTTISATNHSSEPVRLESSMCNRPVAMWSNAARTGTPAWDQRSEGVRCLDGMITTIVPPGQTVEMRAYGNHYRVPAMLGSSLPTGHYWFRQYLFLNGTTVPVDVGDAVLDRTQAPLPETRLIEGIRWNTRVERLPGRSDSLRVLITAKNETSGTVVAKLGSETQGEFRPCVAGLIGYAQRNQRDFGYLVSSPAEVTVYWQPPCMPGFLSVSLAPGASHTFEQVSVAPTAPITLYLEASLYPWANQPPPWVGQAMSWTNVAAGEITLP